MDILHNMPINIQNKICKDCLIQLDENNINKYDLDQSQYVCKNCRKLRDKQKYINRREIIREQQRLYDLSVKTKVIEGYGGKCACCNENNFEFLTINNNAKEHIKNGGKLYRWLIANNFPQDKYKLLCYNCNSAKEIFGYCPHQKIIISPD